MSVYIWRHNNQAREIKAKTVWNCTKTFLCLFSSKIAFPSRNFSLSLCVSYPKHAQILNGNFQQQLFHFWMLFKNHFRSFWKNILAFILSEASFVESHFHFFLKLSHFQTNFYLFLINFLSQVVSIFFLAETLSIHDCCLHQTLITISFPSLSFPLFLSHTHIFTVSSQYSRCVFFVFSVIFYTDSILVCSFVVVSSLSKLHLWPESSFESHPSFSLTQNTL